MSLLATAAPTVIAAASAAAAVAALFAYIYFMRRTEAHAARDEALALAETRGEVIVDLRGRLAALEERLTETMTEYETRVRELEAALETTQAEAREHAYLVHRFYTASLADLLRDLQADLKKRPPNVQRPLARIRELLDGERPAA
jgi:Skp family chaperone for outer membrane proteins